MKKLKLLSEYYKHSLLPSILLLVILTVTALEILVVLGQYEYNLFGYEETKEYLYNADYVMSDGGFATSRKQNAEAFRQMDGVRGVIYMMTAGATVLSNENTNCNVGQYEAADYRWVQVLLYSEDYFGCYKNRLDGGKYPQDVGKETEFECITNISGLSQGDILHFIPIALTGKNGYDGSKATMTVTGTFSSEYKLLNMSITSNVLDLEDLYEYYEGDVIIIPLSDYAIDYFKQNYLAVQGNFFVLYDEGITAEQKALVREEIGKNDYYLPVKESIEVSVEKELKELRGNHLILWLLLFLSTISFIVIYILSTYRKMKEFSIYYIHGASRKQIFSTVFLATTVIAIIPIIVSFVFIRIYMRLEYFKSQAEELIRYIFYDYHVLVVAGYLMLLVMLSTLISWLMIAKLSPAQIYRKMIR